MITSLINCTYCTDAIRKLKKRVKVPAEERLVDSKFEIKNLWTTMGLELKTRFL